MLLARDVLLIAFSSCLTAMVAVGKVGWCRALQSCLLCVGGAQEVFIGERHVLFITLHMFSLSLFFHCLPFHLCGLGRVLIFRMAFFSLETFNRSSFLPSSFPFCFPKVLWGYQYSQFPVRPYFGGSGPAV